MENSTIFTPCEIGPITLRNRVIRSAAFENMAYGNRPSDDLFNYHVAVARGGVGMTTVAYAAVSQSGLSFDGQLWMREEIVPELKRLTDAVHSYGAKASIQLGHCGNMTHRSTCGCMPVGPSGGFNAYSPTFVRKLRNLRFTSLSSTSVRLSIWLVRLVLTVSKSMRDMVTSSASFYHLIPTIAMMSLAVASTIGCVS